MESTFTTLTAGVRTPVEPVMSCLGQAFGYSGIPPVLNPDQLDTTDQVRMVAAMLHSISRLDRTNPTECFLYCGIADALGRQGITAE